MYSIVRPLLFRLNPELAHQVGLGAARVLQHASAVTSSVYKFEHSVLSQYIWGIDFANPIGLAAGLDKNGVAVPFWASLGFGFVEVGSVSTLPWPGNPKPRMFRLPDDRAVINRMGLNNHGSDQVARRLGKLAKGLPPLGVNIVKTPDPRIVGEAAIEDFRHCLQAVLSSASYVTLNVSCPNTSEGKTFEDPVALDALLAVVISERNETHRNVPILVKLSPPMFDRTLFDSRVDEIVAVGLAHGIDGFVLCNTMSARDGLRTSADRVHRIGAGGLSGQPVEGRTTRMIRYVHRKSDGRIPIVGVGGVSSAEDAFRKILAGASLVQLYTGLIYEGPGVVKRIKSGLSRLLLERGFRNVREAIGAEDQVDDITDPGHQKVRALTA